MLRYALIKRTNVLNWPTAGLLRRTNVLLTGTTLRPTLMTGQKTSLWGMLQLISRQRSITGTPLTVIAWQRRNTGSAPTKNDSS